MTGVWRVEGAGGDRLVHRDGNTGDVTTLTVKQLGRAAFLPLRAAVAAYDQRETGEGE